MSKNENIILWGSSGSPYVRKVIVALEEKKLPHELKETLPGILLRATGQTVPSDFEQASPLGKTPALQLGDFSISDSAIISVYLDSKFSTGCQLYPKSPEEFAQARWFENYSDIELSAVLFKKIFLENVVKPNILKINPNKEMVEKAYLEELPPLLCFLDVSLQGKEWFAGENFSMADVAVVTQLLALEMSGFSVSEKTYPALSAHMAKTLERQSFDFLKS